MLVSSLNPSSNYVTRVYEDWAHIQQNIGADAWNALLDKQDLPSPFMRFEYLRAMSETGCATSRTGWILRLITLWEQGGKRLAGLCAVYLKTHSRGEYVFDHAWANAYQQQGLDYYPKALSASPFTPVPSSRLIAIDRIARKALLEAVIDWCESRKLPTLHLLFTSPQDQEAALGLPLMQRHTVQFHWQNIDAQGNPYTDFDAFLAHLKQDKRKKIRQERRKVSEVEISFVARQGSDIANEDWDFFYRCYSQTYYEHGNAPYLTRDFFTRMQTEMPEHWVMFMAMHEGAPVACSLVALDPASRVAYGRYWGAVARADSLHFEACYYQPIAWCIANGYKRFEGGAQGEHKMARALMPVRSTSLHWIADPQFEAAIKRFLEREALGVASYEDDLNVRSPLRKTN